MQWPRQSTYSPKNINCTNCNLFTLCDQLDHVLIELIVYPAKLGSWDLYQLRFKDTQNYQFWIHFVSIIKKTNYNKVNKHPKIHYDMNKYDYAYID